MSHSNHKLLYIETYGCQMNRLDSELLWGLFSAAGYERAEAKETADVILVNTCSVRSRAEQRTLGRISELGGLKRNKPDLVLGVVGCMAQRLGEQLFADHPYVDLVAGPDAYRELPALINSERTRIRAWSPDPTETYEGLSPKRDGGLKAWVAVMRGCNNFCSYCIVPSVRGRERSRSVEAVLNEIHGLVQEGVQEVTLLGQNVNSYRDKDTGFAELLSRLDRETDIRRVRFLSSHPKDMSGDVLRAMADGAAVCEHLHLALQSGSSAILERMNRNYTSDAFMELVDRARAIIPGLSVTTDIIAGFPGETKGDFEQTLDVMRRLRFDAAFTYRYSPRSGTKAFDMEDDVPDAEKLRRLDAMIALQQAISKEKNRALIGTKAEILMEAPSKCGKGVLGRTRTDKPVVVHDGNLDVGDWAEVEIIGSTGATLVGREAEGKRQRSEARGQGPEVRDQRSGVRSQGSEV
ncbi:MAG: tRNA (N6-isopentenyl adenosine(37)-C2)-methylthiotransferase MiaB, partial [Candidatus Latescibacteria bacterium]|nr:tRNA (N6-isopentenyl adenosine(37)-C2)-methylthiotransferase MiaB [Candidatus Latescibacterota bacterium]